MAPDSLALTTDERESLGARLRQIVGNDHVVDDEAQREYFSRDLSYHHAKTASLVVSPATTQEVADIVTAAAESGFSVVQRGGGMSYSRGYVPFEENSVMLDMRRMNRVLEVNTDDMYVTVECGCTWKELYETLSPHGVRTPYWGPLSGMYATVGGALSQNSLFHGSGVHGTVADSVIGMHVVLANGSVLVTGSGAHKNSNAFWRHFGPDVTGLFTADTGAFGVKTVATLRLVPLPKHTAFLSYKFDTLEQMLRTQTRIARLGIASECYGFDPYYNNSFEKQGVTFEEGLSVIGKIARKGGVKGIKQAAKVALGGKKILRSVPYSLHMTFDGLTERVAAEHMDMAAEICVEEGGVEMTNALPTIFRNQPFGGVRTVLLGSEGEIWIPVHGFFPLSKAVEAGAATERFFEQHRATLEKYDIRTSYLTCFTGPEFVIEPSLYWRDQLGSFRLSLIEPEFQEKWKDIPADEEKRKIALDLRDGLRDLYDSLGALHLQIGKYYHYQSLMDNEALPQVLADVKQTLDPQGMMNPGVLGLGRAQPDTEAS